MSAKQEAELEALVLWRKSGGHLPEFMDYDHDTDFMRAIMEETYEYAERHGYPEPNSVFLHCWLYDVVLWRLAACGYTIQRSRKKGLKFRDIHDYIRGAVLRGIKRLGEFINHDSKTTR